jgi:hypothetical protein
MLIPLCAHSRRVVFFPHDTINQKENSENAISCLFDAGRGLARWLRNGE